jgi:hypothetical protein
MLAGKDWKDFQSCLNVICRFDCSETRFYTSSNLYFIKQDHQIATINIQKV